MKQAVVTGGTRGIGAGVARTLASSGWSVVAASVSRAEINAFEPQGGITTALLDVTDQTSLDDFIQWYLSPWPAHWSHPK